MVFNANSIQKDNKAVTFSHQVHGSGSSLAYLQYRRGNPSRPPRWRRLWNCAVCAHNTAFVGRPLLKEQGRHLQPPCAWIRVLRSLLAVPSRHPEQPPRWRRLWNCAICAHNTAFVGRPLLKEQVSHLQPPCAWVRVIRSLLTVPSRQPQSTTEMAEALELCRLRS
ncbi:hypothetical protein CDAR_306031 [Caerostris darwini]|uniref:Uncharacterized protein n=1 Tax=Caerostris darwini TaxID=1538125 RepID=A0AAV4VU69_9ARAC|nr:hypothetical protein CDAR_306031 [Caerostris darwini]